LLIRQTCNPISGKPRTPESAVVALSSPTWPVLDAALTLFQTICPRVYKSPVNPCSLHPFSFFSSPALFAILWLRSSVVSVLCTLKSVSESLVARVLFGSFLENHQRANRATEFLRCACMRLTGSGAVVPSCPWYDTASRRRDITFSFSWFSLQIWPRAGL